MKNILLSIFVLFLFNACAPNPSHRKYTPLTGYSYSSKPDNYEIEIFRSSKPSKEYIELGIISAKAGGINSILLLFHTPNYYEKALNLLKKEARKQGGDAVIDIREEYPGTTALTLTGTLIKWK